MVMVENNIRERMKREGMSMRYVADRVGMSYQQMYNIIDGKMDCKLSTALKIAYLFDDIVENIFSVEV